MTNENEATELENTAAVAGQVYALVRPLGEFCPVCHEPLLHGGTVETLVGYSSPKGHNHDDNCRKRQYRCKNNHVFSVSKINKCHSCDWVGKKECFCCPDGKQDFWPDEV